MSNLEFDLDDICKNWGTLEVRDLVMQLVKDAIAYQRYCFTHKNTAIYYETSGMYLQAMSILKLLVDIELFEQLDGYILTKALELKQ